MSRRWFTLAALVAAGLLLVADQAQAQRWGGSGRGMSVGYTPGYGLSVGSGNPYYGGYGYGNTYGYGNGYAPYNSGYGWGNSYSPSYGGYGQGNTYGWGNTYSPYYGNRNYSGTYNTYPSTWDNSWNYPSGTYYGGTMSSNAYGFAPSYDNSGMNAADFDNSMNTQGGRTSFYSNDQRQRERIPETAALINMRLQPNAKVWFFSDETKQQGAFRQFVTPSLDKGKVFFYEIRARWNEGGRDVDRTHRVLVHAGDRINVDFMRDMTNVDEMTPENLRQREQVRPEEGTTPRGERRSYEEGRNEELVNPPTDNNAPIERGNNEKAAPDNKSLPQTDKTVPPPPAKPDGTDSSKRPPQ